MAVTILAGTVTITPILVTGFESERRSGNIIHNVIGREDPDVTLRVASLRQGTLEILMPDDASSKAAEDALAAAVRCTITSDLDGASFPFVIQEGGTIRRTLDPDTRVYWTVAAPFQEVPA